MQSFWNALESMHLWVACINIKMAFLTFGNGTCYMCHYMCRHYLISNLSFQCNCHYICHDQTSHMVMNKNHKVYIKHVVMTSELLFVWEKPHSLVACFFSNHGKRCMYVPLVKPRLCVGLEMLLHHLLLTCKLHFQHWCTASNFCLESGFFWTLGEIKFGLLVLRSCVLLLMGFCVLFSQISKGKD